VQLDEKQCLRNVLNLNLQLVLTLKWGAGIVDFRRTLAQWRFESAVKGSRNERVLKWREYGKYSA
jgi:hypothetical protein